MAPDMATTCRTLDRFCAGMASALKVAGFALLWAEVVVIGLQVGSRYVLNSSLPWTEEASRLILVWLTFVGASASSFLGVHLRFDMAEKILRARSARIALLLFVNAGVLVVLVTLLTGNAELIEIREGISFTTIPISSKWLAYSVTVGSILMIVATLAQLARGLLGPAPGTGSET